MKTQRNRSSLTALLAMLAGATRLSSSSREPKPWQKPSDHTPRARPISGWMKEPGTTSSIACKTHRIAAKRVRRKVDGVNRKVWLCPRCERAA